MEIRAYIPLNEYQIDPVKRHESMGILMAKIECTVILLHYQYLLLSDTC